MKGFDRIIDAIVIVAVSQMDRWDAQRWFMSKCVASHQPSQA